MDSLPESYYETRAHVPSIFQDNTVVHTLSHSFDFLRSLTTDEDDESLPLGVHDQIRYNIPYPTRKIDVNYFTPEKEELTDDVLLYIFSFLDYSELFIAGHVCRKWYKITNDDRLWEVEYFRLFEQEFFGHYRTFFVQKMNRHGQLERVRQRMNIVATLQSILVFAYGFLAPMVFICGFLVATIFAPLLMDGILANAQFLSIPIVVTLFAFLTMAIGLIVDPSLVNKMKKRYGKMLRQERAYEIDTTHITYTFDQTRDEGWIPALNLLVWSIFIMPLIPICVLLRWCFFSQLSYSYSLCFVPLYAYTICYLIIPPILMCIKWKHYRKLYENKRMPKYIWLHANLTNFLVSIQAMLVGLKLDTFIQVHWSVVVVPTWCMIGFMLCFGCICGYTTKVYFESSFVKMFRSMCCVQIIFIPIVIFVILFCLKLDNIVQWNYIMVFIPLYVFEGLFACGMFLTTCCCISFRICLNATLLSNRERPLEMVDKVN